MICLSLVCACCPFGGFWIEDYLSRAFPTMFNGDRWVRYWIQCADLFTK
jgi:hypothetical protein